MVDYELESQAWWVEQWNDLLNSYRFKKRLERGRKYAREGKILQLEFAGSKVLARVKGTAAEPYELWIKIEPFEDEDWEYVIATMAEQAIYSAQLLAGEMPANIEEVFTVNGLSLFPFTLSDVHSRCSCPDPKNPCKHIAAVYYQLGERFRADPFVLFQLRGRTQAQILEALRQKRSGGTVTARSGVEPKLKTPPQVEQFWQYEASLDPSLVVITPADSCTVLKTLGVMPLAPVDAQVVNQYLNGVYQQMSQQAMLMALNREA
ncbi:MAG: hypothetical protein F6K19_47375 [Cyanothece sp. SIO1E1]|nr:hypothetical protein [Cyanothece sp. SIO1E1]